MKSLFDPMHWHAANEPALLRLLPDAHGQQLARLGQANEALFAAALAAKRLQQQAEQALAAQRTTLAMVAHELRNPLTLLSLVTGRLAHTCADELPRRQALMQQQIAHLSRLVDDLLDVARADSGKVRLNLAPLDLAPILRQAVEACTPALEARAQAFNLQCPDVPLTVHGDSLRLAQIFFNLLGNACKFTPCGGAIGMQVHVIPSWVQVTLIDTGIGISATALPTVFDAFVQERHAVGFNASGLGIGLTVVRELVHAHGGTVTVRSDGPGCGSCFSVALPLLPGPVSPPARV